MHGLDGNELAFAVEVLAAGGKVGAGQAVFREVAAVCAAADGLNDRGNARILIGFLGPVDDVHHRLDVLFHVEVAVLDGQFYSAFAVFCIDKIGSRLHNGFLFCKFRHIVVPDDIDHFGESLVALDIQQMHKPFIPFGMFRSLVRRQQSRIFHRHEGGILHLIFRRARMDVDAVHGNDSCCSVKVFVLQFSQRTAVHGVSKICPESLDIKAVCASADLFVRRKSHS